MVNLMMIKNCNIPLSSPSKIEGAGGSMTTRIKIILCAIAFIIILATSAAVHAQDKIPWTHGGPLLPDSSNFVTASLLILQPGESMYSKFGHSAIRLECPTHNLDYCFTFENDASGKNVFRYFTGNANACFMSVETQRFVKSYSNRGLIQYELNLTLHEKQLLWKLLDEQITNGEDIKFNVYNNCTSEIFNILKACLIDESIEFNPNDYSKLNNGKKIRYLMKNQPWLEFLGISFAGTDADVTWDLEDTLSPEILVGNLKNAYIIKVNGEKRNVITGKKVLSPNRKTFNLNVMTPAVVFGLLFAFVLIITLLLLKWELHWLGTTIDSFLLLAQTIIGCVLIYMSLIQSLFGQHWNWYIIPFNPLPLIIWLIWHKRKGFYKVYLLYTAVLVLFIIATPLSEQLDLPHQLITATLAVRCFYNYYDGKRNAAAATITTKTKKKTQKNKK